MDWTYETDSARNQLDPHPRRRRRRKSPAKLAGSFFEVSDEDTKGAALTPCDIGSTDPVRPVAACVAVRVAFVVAGDRRAERVDVWPPHTDQRLSDIHGPKGAQGRCLQMMAFGKSALITSAAHRNRSPTPLVPFCTLSSSCSQRQPSREIDFPCD